MADFFREYSIYRSAGVDRTVRFQCTRRHRNVHGILYPPKIRSDLQHMQV